MGITLGISVETPLSDDDRDILAGISGWCLAIAKHQNLADHAEEPAAGGVPIGGELTLDGRPFGSQSEAGEVCVREVGHGGRDKYPPLNRFENDAPPWAAGRTGTIGPQAGCAKGVALA